jgi:hypothetical protein
MQLLPSMAEVGLGAERIRHCILLPNRTPPIPRMGMSTVGAVCISLPCESENREGQVSAGPLAGRSHNKLVETHPVVPNVEGESASLPNDACSPAPVIPGATEKTEVERQVF